MNEAHTESHNRRKKNAQLRFAIRSVEQKMLDTQQENTRLTCRTQDLSATSVSPLSAIPIAMDLKSAT